MRRPLLMYSSAALLGFVVLGSYLKPVAARDDSYKHLSNFSDTLELIRKNYVEPTALPGLLAGAYRGLAEQLDTDTFFLDAAQLKRFRELEKAAPRAGIGVEVAKRHGYAVVLAVLPNSPAAGKLKSGDYIRFIDKQSTREQSLFEVRERLQGEPGSKILLKVVSGQTLESEELELTRAQVPPPELATELLPEGVLRIKVPSIDASALAQIAVKLRASEPPRAVVLDLRGCALGRVADGARLADLFLDSGVILRLSGKTGEARARRALGDLEHSRSEPTPPPAEDASKGATRARPHYEFTVSASPQTTVWKGPLAVLIDSGSSGAAEVAAAALRDAKRATLVGSRSSGRASIQDLLPLDDGALHLTIAQFLAPGGDSLLGSGLEPEEVVEAEATDAVPDPVLDKALERLKPDAPEKKAA